MNPKELEELREKLAAIEHERWADWQRWVHECGTMDWNQDGEQVLTIPLEHIQRWERQIATPYAELTEEEKQSDREQVDRYLHLITTYSNERERLAVVTSLESLVMWWASTEVEPSNKAVINKVGDKLEAEL